MVFAFIFVPFCIFQVFYIECINTGLKKKKKGKKNTISFNMRYEMGVVYETVLQEKWNGVGWGHRGRRKNLGKGRERFLPLRQERKENE